MNSITADLILLSAWITEILERILFELHGHETLKCNEMNAID